MKGLDDISTSIILEKNELMYLISCLLENPQNANAATLAEYTGISEPDDRRAIAGLMKKGVISLADNKLITVKLFDFYIKKLLSAEMVNVDGKKLAFVNPGFVLLVKEHRLSKDYVCIQAFKTKQDLMEALKETGED